MAQRLVCRKRCTYNTRSNNRRKVRTPGNRLVYQKVPKLQGPARCGVSGAILGGVPTGLKRRIRSACKSQRRVSRPYGGCLSHKVVRGKILSAFLAEEKRCALQVLKAKSRANKAPRA